MNKKELIERIECLKNIFRNKNEYVKIDMVVELLSELDEPQKVKIPQFVADYIEFKKTYDFHVYGAMRVIEDHYDKRVPEWFYEKNIETFIRAWLDGYEVEEEKRYRVKFIQTGQHLAKNIFPKSEYFVIKTSAISSTDNFTRKELEEAGFGWVFDCEGIEIEEVEE